MKTTLFEFAKDSIKLFLEYRDGHGCTEDEAMGRAALDMSDPDAEVEITGDEINPYLLTGDELAKLEARAKRA